MFLEYNLEFDSYIFGSAQNIIGQTQELKTTSPNVISMQSQSMPQLNTTPKSSQPKVMPHVAQSANKNIQTSNNTIQINPNNSENSEIPAVIMNDTLSGPMMPVSVIIKGLIEFISRENIQPLWSYEDITAKGKLNFKISLSIKTYVNDRPNGFFCQIIPPCKNNSNWKQYNFSLLFLKLLFII